MPVASWGDKVLILVFLGVISLPLVSQALHFAPAVSDHENRRLARRPPLSLSAASINAFPAAFDAYYSDHFGFRSQLIRCHSLWKLRLFHVSPSPRVILGKEGWLFDDATVDYFRAPALTAEELEKWRLFLEERQRFVEAEHLPYLAVIAPSPCSIYPEFLPDSVRRGARETRLDQLLEYLRRHSHVRILDVRPALLEAKAAGRLYNRTDTHWNDLGAYVAYREIIRALAPTSPGISPLPASAFELRKSPVPGGDIARLLAVPEFFPEEKVELEPRVPRRSQVAEWLPEESNPPAAFSMKIGDPSMPRAIVFHDSFTYASLYPFLAEHFREIWFHWNHYFGPGLRVKVETDSRQIRWSPGELKEGERLPVVIHEIAERLLLYKAPPTWTELSEER
jgi:alginate O-acetyltransferase complex protein AlgJ